MAKTRRPPAGRPGSTWRRGFIFVGHPTRSKCAPPPRSRTTGSSAKPKPRKPRSGRHSWHTCARENLPPKKKKYLSDVEAVALGRSTGSRVLKELGSQATPENAHSLPFETLALGRDGESLSEPDGRSDETPRRRNLGDPRRGASRSHSPSGLRHRRRGEPGPGRRHQPGRRSHLDSCR